MKTLWKIYKVIAVISFILLILGIIGTFIWAIIWEPILIPLWAAWGWWTLLWIFGAITVLVGFGLVTSSREITL